MSRIVYGPPPATPVLARQAAREKAALEAAGLEVVADDGLTGPIDTAPGMAMSFGSAGRGATPGGEPVLTVLRFPDAADPRPWPDLRSRHAGPPRIAVAPAHPWSRRGLAAELGPAALTPDDWPPLIGPFGCWTRQPRRRGPIRAGVLWADGARVASLREALGRHGIAPSALRIEAVDAEEAIAGGLDLLIGPENPAPFSLFPWIAAAALEAGTLPIADRRWRPALGSLAELTPRRQLAGRVAALLARPDDRERRRRALLDAALPRCGEEAFLERVRALVQLGTAGTLPAERSRAFELVVLGDFTLRDATALAVRSMIRGASRAGRSVALLHVASDVAGATVHPGIDADVRDGAATVLGPEAWHVRAEELVVTTPVHAARRLERIRPLVAARRLTLLEGPAAIAPRLAERLAAWASAEEVVRSAVPPIATPPGARTPKNVKPVVGGVVFSEEEARAAARAFADSPLAGSAKLRLLFAGSGTIPVPAAVSDLIDVDGADAGRFLAKLDAFVPAPGETVREGAPPPIRLERDPTRTTARRPRTKRSVAERGAGGSRRVLLITANGVGLGHVTRLAAIARHLPSGLDPVFATMSQAIPVLHAMGFHAELLPGYGGHPPGPWNHWLARRILDLLDEHRPAAVVLDSSNPYPGVLQAVLPRADLPLVWIRRGMWRADQRNTAFLGRSACFDLVIEPEDIAGEADRGATAQADDGAVRVPPISLLDEEDLLPRAIARAELGLDPDRPAVLLQLGSGTTRDLVGLLDDVLRVLATFPALQVVNTPWLIAPADDVELWPQVRQLRGFPIARYFRAFDFTISAAGYNSFNDILRFGLPAIFLANDAPMMDDQAARAAYAQQAHAAFDLRAEDLSLLPDCVEALLNPSTRSYLAERARSLARPNGAAEAAARIAALARRETRP